MKENEIVVEITEKGSQDALPAIWYGGKAGKKFTVRRSTEWPSVYEVTKGYYRGKVIDPKDCIKLD